MISVRKISASSFGFLLLFSCLLLVADPLRVLGGDQRLDPLGEEGFKGGIFGIFVRSGPGEPEVLLVLQPLGGGAVARPVLLKLEESLHRLQDDDGHTEYTSDPCIAPESCAEGYESGGDDFDRL